MIRKYLSMLVLVAACSFPALAYSDDADGMSCELPDESTIDLANSAPLRAEACMGDGEVTQFTKDQVRAYLENYCGAFNRGAGQCRGHAEGLGAALLEGAGAQIDGKKLNTNHSNQYLLSGPKLTETVSELRRVRVDQLWRPDNAKNLKAGMLIHTRCHCSPGGGSCYPDRSNAPDHVPPESEPDKTSDAHHWMVYMGTTRVGSEDVPMVFDNISLAKGCRNEIPEFDRDTVGANGVEVKVKVRASAAFKCMDKSTCAAKQACLDECRAWHRENQAPAESFCDPRNPDSCMYPLKEAGVFVGSGWTATSRYCNPGKVPCVHCIRDIRSAIKK